MLYFFIMNKKQTPYQYTTRLRVYINETHFQWHWFGVINSNTILYAKRTLDMIVCFYELMNFRFDCVCFYELMNFRYDCVCFYEFMNCKESWQFFFL